MSDASQAAGAGGLPALRAGSMVGPGRFTLIRELGRGGMGVVWLAQDTRLDEQVALKFLPPEVAADPVALNDLRRETARSHRLTHPNIIRLHDFHEQPDGIAFISMEYVDGMTLSGWRLQQPQQVFGWEQLAPLVQQLCGALEYAHSEGVIHRDLKPANVMLDQKGRVKLADFGIAAVVSDSASRVSVRSRTGGTLPYMSPQQVAGEEPTAADDIYALGATLYELLSGRPPFYRGDITHQVLNVAARPLPERMLEVGIDNPVPGDVAALILACLAKEPAQRPQSARAVAEWIGLEMVTKPSLEHLASQVFSAEPEASSAQSGAALVMTAAPTEARPGRKAAWAFVVFVLLGLLAAGGWYWANRGSGREGQPTAAHTFTATLPVSDRPVTSASASPELAPEPTDQARVEPGFVSIFNGQDLTGWEGNPLLWSVKDGAITGQTTAENPAKRTTFLVWTNGTVGDFELRCSFKLVPGDAKGFANSGIQYRSKGVDPSYWVVHGYQADMEAGPAYTGILYEEGGRGILAARGQKVVLDKNGKKQVVGSVGDGAAIQASIKKGDWNDYVIIAKGHHLQQFVNGKQTIDVTDDDAAKRAMSGVLALELHAGPPMMARFKNIRLKKL